MLDVRKSQLRHHLDPIQIKKAAMLQAESTYESYEGEALAIAAWFKLVAERGHRMRNQQFGILNRTEKLQDQDVQYRISGNISDVGQADQNEKFRDYPQARNPVPVGNRSR